MAEAQRRVAILQFASPCWMHAAHGSGPQPWTAIMWVVSDPHLDGVP